MFTLLFYKVYNKYDINEEANIQIQIKFIIHTVYDIKKDVLITTLMASPKFQKFPKIHPVNLSFN